MRNLLLVFGIALGLGGCQDPSLGRPCLVAPIFCETDADCARLSAGELKFICEAQSGTCLEDTAGVSGAAETRFTTDAIECESAICILMEGGDLAACTQGCSSDADCSEYSEGTCTDETGAAVGFVCIKPISTGAELGCKKLCVCRDDAIREGFYDEVSGAQDPQVCINMEQQ
jgi:hypothetical protein